METFIIGEASINHARIVAAETEEQRRIRMLEERMAALELNQTKSWALRRNGNITVSAGVD